MNPMSGTEDRPDGWKPNPRITSIVLRHIGGELKEVPVETITRVYVSIRWGQSGVYDLNLASNTLRARSVKAQRKGRPHWKAADIESLRKQVANYLRGEDLKAETLKAMERHQATMPGNKIGLMPITGKALDTLLNIDNRIPQDPYAEPKWSCVKCVRREVNGIMRVVAACSVCLPLHMRTTETHPNPLERA